MNVSLTKKKPGCYLTSACVEYAGLSDDCYELETLRNFRDTYVKQLPNGDDVLIEYYKYAPYIVDNIEKSDKKNSVLEKIYNNIKMMIPLIENGEQRQAYDSYKKMFNHLKKDWITRD